MSDDALMATCWSSAGDAARTARTCAARCPCAGGWRPPRPPASRGSVCSATTCPAAVAEHGLPGIRTMLADNGMAHVELESIPYWWDDGAHRAESDRVRHALLEAAEVLQPRHLKVTPDGENRPWDRARWAVKFAELAAQADGVGARLGIEFFPWANVSLAGPRGCASSRMPGTRRAASSSTPGTSSAPGTPTADLATVPLDRIIGVEPTTPTSTWSEPCSRTPSTAVATAVRVRSTWSAWSRHCAPPGGPGRGVSRSCPRSTGRFRSRRPWPARPGAPVTCWPSWQGHRGVRTHGRRGPGMS